MWFWPIPPILEILGSAGASILLSKLAKVLLGVFLDALEGS
jgi:hypothetical protein